MKQDDVFPVEVPARGSVSIPFTLEVLQPGPFSHQGMLFLDDGSLREAPVAIRGDAVNASRSTETTAD